MAEGASTSSADTRGSAALPGGAVTREHRKTTSWTALIRLAHGTELPCLIRDVSRTGAKLVVPSPFPLARKFLVKKLEDPVFVLSVTLIWRRANHVGVKIDRVARFDSDDTAADERQDVDSSD